MEHLGTKRLKTKRLVLREFAVTDAEAMYRNWASDPEVTKYLMWPTHPDVETSQRVIDSWIEKYTEKNFYSWAIELKEIGEAIGSIAVVNVNDRVSSVAIGYCIGSKWWHKGIMTEAFTEVIRFLFDEVGVNRISAVHEPDNPNSGLVMKKCGLRYEGTRRQASFSNQGICDICDYGILKSDYMER